MDRGKSAICLLQNQVIVDKGSRRHGTLEWIEVASRGCDAQE